MDPDVKRVLEVERGDGRVRELKEDAAQALARIAALALYMASSAGMIIFNKLVLREVDLPIALCIIQMAFTVLLLGAVPVLRRTIHFGSRRDTWRWARIIPPLFAIMLASSMMALKHASMGACATPGCRASPPALAPSRRARGAASALPRLHQPARGHCRGSPHPLLCRAASSSCATWPHFPRSSSRR